MTSNPKKTLVYHAGALGDFVTILPAISLWHQLNPGAQIDYLGRRAHGELGKAAGYFTEALDIDRSIFASLFLGTLSNELSTILSSYDSGVAFTDDDSPVLKSFSHLDVLHQPPFSGNHEHVVDYHLSLFPSWEREKAVRHPTIRILTKNTDLAGKTGRFAIIAPGSGSTRKNWPVERFAGLAAALFARDIAVLWLLGPAETNLQLPEGVEAIRSMPLTDLCRVLRASELYVGNDSGVSHLAAACGCRCVVLFGASDPAVWRPLGRAVKVINGLAPCSPCHGEPAPDVDCRNACMEQIGAATVIRECLEALGS